MRITPTVALLFVVGCDSAELLCRSDGVAVTIEAHSYCVYTADVVRAHGPPTCTGGLSSLIELDGAIVCTDLSVRRNDLPERVCELAMRECPRDETDAAVDRDAVGPPDAERDSSRDSGFDASSDAASRSDAEAGMDAGATEDATSRLDASGTDGGPEAALDASMDAPLARDAAMDAARDGDAGSSLVVDIAAGAYHSCAVLEDGAVFCWGLNEYGQLGNGTTSGAPTSRPVRVLGVDDAVQVAAGKQFTCALRGGGTVTCWGSNTQGELGDGLGASSTMAVSSVSGIADAASITASEFHACARLATGQVRCWGRNAEGELGDGTRTPRLVPVDAVGVTAATDVVSMHSHTCAVQASSAWCWGNNDVGQTGTGAGTFVTTPAMVMHGVGATVAVAGGSGHTCGVLSDGSVWCWGTNAQGQLGDGTMITPPAAVSVVGVTDAEGIASVYQHVCVSGRSGLASCWGYNVDSQTGDGARVDRSIAFTLPAPVGVARVAVGYYHSCALLLDGGVACWGDNNHGEIGSGVSSDFVVPPARVVGLP